jgi:hypothetical protein
MHTRRNKKTWRANEHGVSLATNSSNLWLIDHQHWQEALCQLEYRSGMADSDFSVFKLSLLPAFEAILVFDSGLVSKEFSFRLPKHSLCSPSPLANG